MSVYITSLNSGSNGNCYYVGNNNEAILIDAGISCREIEKRLVRLNLSLSKIKAVFVSHEHTDHIKGISTLVKKYRIPLYITENTFKRCNLAFDDSLVYYFHEDKPIEIGELKITAFSKTHDAIDPHSFIVQNKETTIGIFTDIGIVCNKLTTYFKVCNAAFLESNYCEELLENGSYPFFLKNRIRGGKGHLSNKQALTLFENYRSENLSLLILSHLSHNNNCENLVRDLFLQKADSTKIVVASRHKETEVFEIKGSSAISSKKEKYYEQISLF